MFTEIVVLNKGIVQVAIGKWYTKGWMSISFVFRPIVRKDTGDIRRDIRSSGCTTVIHPLRQEEFFCFLAQLTCKRSLRNHFDELFVFQQLDVFSRRLNAAGKILCNIVNRRIFKRLEYPPNFVALIFKNACF